MYTYNQNQLLNYFSAVLQRNLTADAWNWLIETTGKISTGDNAALFTAFSSAHRRTGKNTLQINKDEIEGIAQLVDNFSLHGYTAERLARVWVLLHWPTEDRENYIKAVSELFKAAEMNELVALYGALPLFPFPEAWTAQCSEGIRSNIGSVLETVICNNPYPANYLSEPAWNQMVLKAFFTDKAVEQIIGLDERANKARFLIMRMSAGRHTELSTCNFGDSLQNSLMLKAMQMLNGCCAMAQIWNRKQWRWLAQIAIILWQRLY
jgi:hypothetical protein